MFSLNKFLSCDWGVSSFRLRLIDRAKEEISSEILSGDGMAETYQRWQATERPESERINFYKNTLAHAVSRLPATFDRNIPILISGMASSSIGMTEMPYQKFPFSWDVSRFIVQKIEGDKEWAFPLYIISGFKTGDDVMRGEETLLLGCDPGDDDEKIFIFPGTHSKHVFVKNKTGFDFKTYLTGELFHLLAEKSILRSAVLEGTDKTSFVDGLKAGRDDNLLHAAFRIRAKHLLQQTDPVSNYQYLSGLLIGTELKDLEKKDCPVNLVCADHLKNAYLLGLELMGFKNKVNYHRADDMLVRGHCKISDHYLK